MRLVFATVLVAALFLGGCASGARMSAMTASVQDATLIGSDSPLHHAVRVGAVRGGQETNPLWIPRVSNEVFREALENTLELHTILAEGAAPRFELDTELVELDQPLVGVDMTVSATVRYRLTDLATGSVVFDQQIETPYTARFFDSLNANERIRLATEGAIREGMETFVRRLVEGSVARPPFATMRSGPA